VIRREVGRERERQPEVRRELRAEETRAKEPDRHVRSGAWYGPHELTRLRRGQIRLQLDDIPGKIFFAGREIAAQGVCTALLAGEPVTDAGDDAQLLAGATLAAFAKPGDYATISSALAQALTASFEHDAIWSPIKPDPVRYASVVVDVEEFGPSLDIVWE